MSVFKPADASKRQTGDEREWNRYFQAALEKVKEAMKRPCRIRKEFFCCSPNLPEASQPQCTLTYSPFFIPLSSYSNPAVSNYHQKRPHEYHRRAQEVEQWFCLSGKAAAHTYRCVSSYLCSRKRILWPQVTTHNLLLSLSISHSRFDSPEV